MMMPNTNQHKHQVKKVFFACVSKALFVYRFMGLLPIEGLLNTYGHKTRFTLKSLYSIFFGMVVCTQGMCLALIYYSFLTKDAVALKDSLDLIISLTCSMVWICLYHLCKSWTPSLRKIEYIETLLTPLRSHKILVRRIKWFIFIMLLICLVEFIAYTLYAIMIVQHCSLVKDDSGWYSKSYFIGTNPWFYNQIPFTYVSGGILQIVKLQTIVMCHLADIIIVVVIAYLTARVKNFYGYFVQKLKRPGREVPWFEIRVQFTRLTTLVSTVDDLISPFVLTSFLSHLLFLCKQLYVVLPNKQSAHVLQKNDCVFNLSRHGISMLFFFLSIGVLSLRSSMVSLTAAHLHTLGREPLNALHFVPTSVYNYEMQRLMDQVYHSKIGLSGLRFFYVTRGTVLSMISTILTYELVLLQM